MRNKLGKYFFLFMSHMAFGVLMLYVHSTVENERHVPIEKWFITSFFFLFFLLLSQAKDKK